MPRQWEYQIGPTESIAACDQLWVSRYIIQRISDWNGAECHGDFSVEEMRKPLVWMLIVKIYQIIDKRTELFVFFVLLSNRSKMMY